MVRTPASRPQGAAVLAAGIRIEPAALRADVYPTDVDASCARCAATADPAFPLASKDEICAILGYV